MSRGLKISLVALLVALVLGYFLFKDYLKPGVLPKESGVPVNSSSGSFNSGSGSGSTQADPNTSIPINDIELDYEDIIENIGGFDWSGFNPDAFRF